MGEKDDHMFSIGPQWDEEAIANRIHIWTAEKAFRYLNSDYMRQWYLWHTGVLFPYGFFQKEHYWGGLTKELFILVPADLVEQRRRFLLRQLIRKGLGKVEVEEDVLEACCRRAEQEILEDYNPRPHPAFEADAQARQVSYWMNLLLRRKIEHSWDWHW